MFDGQRLVLVHSDALSEVTFTVPSPSSHSQSSSQSPPGGHTATLQAELTSTQLNSASAFFS